MEAINNFREYSIYTTRDGKSLRRGMLFRSASLHKATENDVREIEKLNIGYILDFRSDPEAVEKPDRKISNCEYRHVALKSNEVKKYDQYSGDPSFYRLIPAASKEAFRESYKTLPFANPCIQTLFDYLLKDDDKAILHHCAAGKDRAGVAAAMVLKTLGVSDDTIVEDYLKSNEYYQNLMNDIFSDATREEYEKYSPCIHFVAIADEDYIRTSLDCVNEKYPDFNDYLYEEYGIDSAKKEKILRKYIEG